MLKNSLSIEILIIVFRPNKTDLKNPAYMPPTFYVDIMKHFEKSSALFLVDRSEAKGINVFSKKIYRPLEQISIYLFYLIKGDIDN